MGWSLVLDVALAGLLVVTITYAAVLNRRLGHLRRDRSELERMASSFHQATTRAEASVGKLKVTADALQKRIDKAQALADDLSFLIDRGAAAADRLEEKVRTARKEGAPVEVRPASAEIRVGAKAGPRRAGAGGRPASAKATAPEPRSEAERELLRALQAAR